MSPLRRIFFSAGLLLALGQAAAQTASSTETTPPVSPEVTALPVIADAAHDPVWRDLLAQLAPTQTRQARFEERRYFPFRSTPVVLTGEIRIVPDRGLSLHYLTPRSLVLIADARGLLMRDEEGRERAAPDDSRTQAATTALVNVLRFNLPELQKSFSLHGRREGERWTLGFEPRDPALAETVGSLLLSGEDLQLRKIELIRSARQRIEILIGETQDNVIFTGDTVRRFFR